MPVMKVAKKRGHPAPVHNPNNMNIQQIVISKLATPNILKMGVVNPIFSASILSVNTS